MGSKLNVLLADDSKFFRAIESKFLQKTPVEILEATKCAEVHAMIRDEHPALIYMSLPLPDEGGDICCSKIKNDPELKSIPIVMVCDQNDETQPAKAQRSGCDACLVKPLDRYSFLQAR